MSIVQRTSFGTLNRRNNYEKTNYIYRDVNDDRYSLLRKKFGDVRDSRDFFYIKCPICGAFKRFIPKVGIRSGCWKCEREIFISDLLDIDFVPDTENYSHSKSVYVHPQASEWIAKHHIPVNQLPQGHPALQFLHKDYLFDLDRYWEDYRVCYIPYNCGKDINFYDSEDALKSFIRPEECLLFPVYFNYKMVGWQIRFVPGTHTCGKMGRMRYLHVFPKGEYLVNYDIAKNYRTVVVVEGYKKMLKLPQCVATLGKGISEVQVQMLQEWDRIILAYDSEDETQEKARKLTMEIDSGTKQCRNLDLSKYYVGSPDEITTKQFMKILTNEFGSYFT